MSFDPINFDSLEWKRGEEQGWRLGWYEAMETLKPLVSADVLNKLEEERHYRAKLHGY